MKKIMLSALAAVLGFGCLQNADGLGAASNANDNAIQRQQEAAPAPVVTPQQYQPQQYTPVVQTPAKLDEQAKKNIVADIKRDCAISNVRGWPINLKKHFRKLAEAIQSDDKTEIQNSLSNISGFNTNSKWKDAKGKVIVVRKAVYEYFYNNSAYYGGDLLKVVKSSLEADDKWLTEKED